MTESDAFRICPRCDSHHVPTLVVRSGRSQGCVSDWRCRSCGFAWSDRDYVALRAS